jgi:hypothetical protein
MPRPLRVHATRNGFARAVLCPSQVAARTHASDSRRRIEAYGGLLGMFGARDESQKQSCALTV